MHDRQRRKFLSLGAKTLCGAGLALGSSPWHTLANIAHADTGFNDYRALVCVYLEGGMDGFSLLVPDGDAEYAEYVASRGDLSVARSGAIPLQMRSAETAKVRLHPSCAPLADLYDDGRLAFINNVGTLIEPTTKEQYETMLFVYRVSSSHMLIRKYSGNNCRARATVLKAGVRWQHRNLQDNRSGTI